MKIRTTQQQLSKLAEHAPPIRITGWTAAALAALGITIWLSSTATHQPRHHATPPGRVSSTTSTTSSSLLAIPAPTQPPQPPPPPKPPTTSYTVQPGDTLAAIAQRHDVPFELIATHNAIADPNQIVAGTQLGIPARPFGVVVIQRHATLNALASTYGVSRDRLRTLNPHITNPNRIHTGGKLHIGAASTAVTA